VKIRTSDWIAPETEQRQRQLLGRTEASLVQFISHLGDSAVRAQHSVALYDPMQRTLGKVSVFKLPGPPPNQQEETLPMVTALWRLPKDVPAGEVRREIIYGGRDRKVPRKPR
jgi:hypothetical protein